MNVFDLNPSKQERIGIGLQIYDRESPMFSREELDANPEENAVYVWSLLTMREQEEEAAQYWPLIPDELKWPTGHLGHNDLK
ncbi:hypothetical protein LGV61_04270 [Desulfurispirillum indicum]|uniref:hypothetical protein n=1 Tax=Desulfurispirillum indicum TaxID=936456 RepID=UPI001CFA3459|nr:hypothetical protein [Desulfurispirillum indicum]UCZ57500.1 hypothetical protein LGV61_04270 [Desulfurispirillum indicum]